MKRVALAIAFLGGCTEAVHRAPDPSPAAPRATAKRSPRTSAGGTANLQPVPRSPAKSEVAEPPTRTIRGKVRDIYGYEVGGAIIAGGPYRSRSDLTGEFEIGVGRSTRALVVSAPGYRDRRARVPRNRNALRVTLVAIGTIGGSVLGGGGGATVHLAGSGVWPPRTTRADSLGRFSFADVAEGIYELRATHPSRASRIVRSVKVEGPGGAATVDLPTVTLARLSGFVTVGGRPLAGALVTVSEDRMSLLALDVTTGERGSFQLDAAAGPYWLRARKGGLVPAPPLLLTLAPAGTTVNVKLSKGATVAGRVLLHDGKPAAGASLRYWAEGTGAPVSVSVRSLRSRRAVARSRSGSRVALENGTPHRTDARGRFVLSGIPEGRVRLWARHRLAAVTVSSPMTLAEGEQREILLRLKPACSLRGRVLDNLGNPVEKARIVLDMPGGSMPRRVLRSAEGGYFTALHLPPGIVRVGVSTPGLLPAFRRVRVRPGDEPTEVTIALVRGATTIEGLVADAEGTALVGALVSLSGGPAGSTTRSGVTDGVGHFEFRLLPAGRYDLLVRYSGLPPYKLNGVDGSEALDLRLGGGGSVYGSVTDVDGRPLRARISARRVAEGDGAAATFVANSPTDPVSGRFQLKGLPVGRYVLIAEAPGYGRGEKTDLEISEAEELEMDFSLRPKEVSPMLKQDSER